MFTTTSTYSWSPLQVSKQVYSTPYLGTSIVIIKDALVIKPQIGTYMSTSLYYSFDVWP